MSITTQVRAVASAGAEFRLDAFGVTAQMDGETTTFQCYYAPVRSLEQLSVLGFSDDLDTILRVAKTETNFSAVIGKVVRLTEAAEDGTDILVRLHQHNQFTHSPEYVFGCKSIATTT